MTCGVHDLIGAVGNERSSSIAAETVMIRKICLMYGSWEYLRSSSELNSGGVSLTQQVASIYTEILETKLRRSVKCNDSPQKWIR